MLPFPAMKTGLLRDMAIYLAAVLVLGSVANLVPGRQLAWWGQGITPPQEGVDFQWLDPASADALRQALPAVVFVDTRSADAYAAGHVPGALRLTYTDLPRELTPEIEARLRRADAVILYGDTVEADPEQLMAQELTRMGLPPPYILIGGFEGWNLAGAEVATGGTP